MSLKEDATTVAVLKALRDIIGAEYEAARQRSFVGLCEARDKVGLKSIRVTLPDDTPVRPASRGRLERARAHTIPKPPEGQSRKADAGRNR
jgi:hypothetical protein